jgi:long-subunit fatty acid transport protein
MGDAFTAIADNASAPYYNPAGLGFLPQREVSVSYSAMSFDRQFNHLGFATPLKNQAGFALGVIQSGFDDYAARADNGETYGETIGDNQWAVFMGFAIHFTPKFSIGIAPKFLYSKVYDVSSSSFGVDVGAMVRPVENLTLGLVVKELGQSFKYTRDAGGFGDETTEDKLPRTTRAGAAYRLPLTGTVSYVLGAVDVEMTTDQPSKWHLGVEADVRRILQIRIGSDNGDPTAGLAVPFSVREKKFRFDYAYILDRRSGVGNGSQDLSLTFVF